MKLEIKRDATTYMDAQSGVAGRRGFICVRSDRGKIVLQLPCIERAGDSIRLGVGRYVFEMSEFVSRSELKRAAEEKREPERKRCLRVLRALEAAVTDELARSIRERHMLVHSANWPSQLMGCIAPGLEIGERGVVDSGDALDLIFRVLGGFEMGRSFELEVIA